MVRTKIMTTLLILILQALLAAGVSGQELQKLNQFIQSPISSDAAKAFREARDLIKNGEWAKAEQSFNRFVTDHPQDRETAAALYWLSFALKQQSKLEDADRALTQLIEKFPASSWTNDARTMRVEIAPKLKNNAVIEQGVSAENEEIKLAALQSLFEAKPERGFAIAADLLKPGSGASRVMKEGAISLLTDADSKEAVTVLINVVREETDRELRKKAVRALGIHDDERVLESLKALALQTTDRDISRIAMEALTEHEGSRAQALLLEIARSNAEPELRLRAIRGLAEREDDSVVDELLKIFATEKNEEVRKGIIEALAEREGPHSVDRLIQLYDAEKDEGMKERILSALGESEEKKALRKLMEIARRDPSIKLRKKAIEMIAHSDDPEAAAFLEEILKKN